jgi:hypothetical protein
MSGDAEIRLGCLELAVQIARPSGDYSPDGVVNIARLLYNFCQASTPDNQPVEIADKSSRGRKPKPVDILS